MKAFDQTFKLIFILRCIDRVEQRQAIEKQLNLVELANGSTRVVAVGSPHGLEHSDREAQETAKGWNRLIKKNNICGNCPCLSRLVESAGTPEERDRFLKMVALQSPMAWEYINLLGEYDLSPDRL